MYVATRSAIRLLDVDGGRVYWVSGQSLNSASLKDGSSAWSQPLSGPKAGWAVDLTERWVLGVPRLAETRRGARSKGSRFVFRRRDDGRLVQRIVFPVPVTEVAVRLTPGGLVVATQGGLWALGSRAQVDAPGADR